MVGNIASGKTTWIRKFLTTSDGAGFVVLSKDAIRWMLGGGNKYLWSEELERIIDQVLYYMTAEFMRSDSNIIIDETNVDITTRSVYLNCAEIRRLVPKNQSYYDYEMTAVVMPTIDVETVIDRRCGAVRIKSTPCFNPCGSGIGPCGECSLLKDCKNMAAKNRKKYEKQNGSPETFKREAWGVSESIWRDVWKRKQALFEQPTKNEGFNHIIMINEKEINGIS